MPSADDAVLTGLTGPAGAEAATGRSSPDDAVLTGSTDPAGVEVATGRSSGALGPASPHPVAAIAKRTPITASLEIALRQLKLISVPVHMLK